MLPLWSRRGSARPRASVLRARGRRAAPGSPSGARAGSGGGWPGSCGPSRSRAAAAAHVRALRSSAPRGAARVRSASRRSMSSTTWRTTRRATCRLASGSASRRLISVAARCTSGVTDSSTSGSSSSRCSPSRSIASCCTTRTTPVGKCERSSPSQRATVGADAPSPPCRIAVHGVQRAVDPAVLAPERTPVPSASSPPSTSRHRRSRSSLTFGSPAASRRSPARARARSASIKRNVKGTGPFRFAEAFAEAAALGRGEDGEGAAQEREDVGEGVGGDGRDPAVEDASRSGSWTSTRPQVPMKPSIQLAPRSGSSPGRERARHRWRPGSSSPASCRRRVARPASVPGAGRRSATRRSASRQARVRSASSSSASAPLTPSTSGRELRARLLVGADARARQADRDAQDDPAQHLRDRGRVAAADVAVAQDRRPAAGRRPSGRRCRGPARRGRRARRSTSSSASGRSASRTASASSASAATLSCSRRPRAAPAPAAAASTVVPQRLAWIRSSASSGLPLEPERLLERAARAATCAGAPQWHLEQVQAVQQPAALAVVLAPQVERELLDLRLRLQAQPPLQARDVLLERDHRRVRRAPRRAGGRRRARARTSASGTSEPWQSTARVASSSSSRPGQRPLADARQRAREPRGVDDLRGGRVEALGAQQPRGAREPARDRHRRRRRRAGRTRRASRRRRRSRCSRASRP